MLQKYNNGKPVYLKMEEHFLKNILEPMEEERERKLEEIKSQHQPIEPEEL
jgi:hypothetical protein